MLVTLTDEHLTGIIGACMVKKERGMEIGEDEKNTSRIRTESEGIIQQGSEVLHQASKCKPWFAFVLYLIQ